MDKYIVTIRWSDGEDSVFSQDFTWKELREMLDRELTYTNVSSNDDTQLDEDYPVGVYPVAIQITRVKKTDG